MRAEEIDPQTWLITRGNGQASTHNYLIVGEKKAALIDTGLDAEDLRAYTATLTDKPIVVLHTHGHIDHIGNDQQFEEIMLHPQDFSLFQLHSTYVPYALPPTDNSSRLYSQVLLQLYAAMNTSTTASL